MKRGLYEFNGGVYFSHEYLVHKERNEKRIGLWDIRTKRHFDSPLVSSVKYLRPYATSIDLWEDPIWNTSAWDVISMTDTKSTLLPRYL